MTHKKKILLGAAALSMIGGTVLSSSPVFAQGPNFADDPRLSLVQKIADKFGLNKNDVQAVFDQNRADMQAQREAEYETRLTQLVTDGKISDAQKQLLLAKHEELQASRQADMDSWRDKTPSERQAAMNERRTALETWASQNGIDIQYLMMGPGEGRGGHGMRGRHFSIQSNSTDTTQQ